MAPDEKPIHDHRTGRKCVLCKGVLLDSIIHFGEYLPEVPLKLARQHAKKADLCLALGSSITIPPASEIPTSVGQSRKATLTICNLQDTPLDYLCETRVHAKADDLIIHVMDKLDIPIPPFVLHRKLVVKSSTNVRGQVHVLVFGEDVDGTPISFLRSVKCLNNRREVRSEPFSVGFRGDLEAGTIVKLELEFMGNYGEPNLEVTYEYDGNDVEETVYLLEYDPTTGNWGINT